jgi:hypothetical protein
MRTRLVLAIVLLYGVAWAGSAPGQLTSQASPQTASGQAAPSAQAPSTPASSPAVPTSDMEGSDPQAVGSVEAADLLPEPPVAPKGKSTLVGGRIGKVDHVRDELTVLPFGGRNLRITLDERTRIYRDGGKVSPGDLRSGEKIYVDTVLEGTTIFAKNIRILTQRSSGEARGQIVSFDPGKAELVLNDPLSSEPVTLHIASATHILREQRPASVADLRPRSLVSVKFRPGSEGVVAGEISILAQPGADFTFEGRVKNLDLHTGLLVLEDPRDQKTHEVRFDPSTVRVEGELVEGAEVTMTADFDGTRYATNAITVRSSPASK